jgi:hypothetical protein
VCQFPLTCCIATDFKVNKLVNVIYEDQVEFRGVDPHNKVLQIFLSIPELNVCEGREDSLCYEEEGVFDQDRKPVIEIQCEDL